MLWASDTWCISSGHRSAGVESPRKLWPHKVIASIKGLARRKSTDAKLRAGNGRARCDRESDIARTGRDLVWHVETESREVSVRHRPLASAGSTHDHESRAVGGWPDVPHGDRDRPRRGQAYGVDRQVRR